VRARSGERTPRRTSVRVSSEQDGTSPSVPNQAAAGSEPRNTSIRTDVSSRTTGSAALVDHVLAFTFCRPRFSDVVDAVGQIRGSTGCILDRGAQAGQRAVVAGDRGQICVDGLANQRRLCSSDLSRAINQLAILAVLKIDLSSSCDVRSIHHPVQDSCPSGATGRPRMCS
jgi:hypothetical protein